ncbi:S-layer homology domain-containing protein [Jeotgalibacillus salarius]|nr:S-layer homology domain-containing protein [Jeotgalibacillus salarius]
MAYQPKSYRKFLAGTVTTALVASAVAPVAGAEGLQAQDNHTTFSDVNPADVHAPNIQKAVDLGLVNGYGDEFRPYNNVTRGQVALILSRWIESEGTTVDTSDTEEFADVPSSYYDEELYEASLVLRELGIFTGTEENNFNPNSPISRQAMAKVLVEAFGLEDLEDVDATVTDIEDAQEWAQDYINILVENGVTVVDEYRPLEYVTRAQFSTFAIRALTVYEESLLPAVTSVEFNAEGDMFTVEFDEEIPEDVTLEWVLENYDVEVNGTPVSEIPEEVLEALALEISNVDGMTVTFSHTDLDDLSDALGGESVELSVGGASDVYTFEVIVEPMVESVMAVNAKQVVVNFNTAVDEDTVIVDAGTDNSLVADTFSISRVPASATTPALNVDADNATGVLSEDGKTLTITAGGAEYFDGTYSLTVADTVETVSGDEFPAFSSTFTVDDTTAPTVSSVDYEVATNTVTVTYSEPLEAAPTTVRQNGQPVSLIAGFTPGDTEVSFLNTATSGTTSTVYTAGAVDYNGNNQTLFNGNVFIDQASTEALTVTSLAQVDSNVARLVFDKAVAGATANDAEAAVAAALSVIEDGNVIDDLDISVTRVATDTTNRSFDVSINAGAAPAYGFYDNGSTTEDVTFLLADGEIEDIFGNENGVFNRTVTMTQDLTGPEVVSIGASTDGTTLDVTFDEDVTIEDLSAFVVRQDGVNIDVLASSSVDDNVVSLVLDPDSDTVADDLTDGTYSVRVEEGAVADVHTNENELITGLTFTYSEDDVASPLTATIADEAAANTFSVTFSEEVTNSGLNAANYTLDGAALPAGTDIYFATAAREEVIIELPEDSVNIGVVGTGTTAVLGVKNVVDLDGDVVSEFYDTVTIEDNTSSDLLSASLVGNNTLVFTFDEALEEGTEPTDFDELVEDFTITGGSTVLDEGTNTGTIASSIDGNQLVVTVTSEGDSNWSTVRSANTITVLTNDGITIQDDNEYEVSGGVQVTVSK